MIERADVIGGENASIQRYETDKRFFENVCYPLLAVLNDTTFSITMRDSTLAEPVVERSRFDLDALLGFTVLLDLRLSAFPCAAGGLPRLWGS